MSTINQLKKNSKIRKLKKVINIMEHNPQLKGVAMKVRICTPKKPNSARRPVAKIYLSTNKFVTAHIPGVGHNLRKHSEVLVVGTGARDLPGINCSCVRGVYDLIGVNIKTKRRSVYGVKRPDKDKLKLRRKFRINDNSSKNNI